jgi:hypothetical protein
MPASCQYYDEEPVRTLARRLPGTLPGTVHHIDLLNELSRHPNIILFAVSQGAGGEVKQDSASALAFCPLMHDMVLYIGSGACR